MMGGRTLRTGLSWEKRPSELQRRNMLMGMLRFYHSELFKDSDEDAFIGDLNELDDEFGDEYVPYVLL